MTNRRVTAAGAGVEFCELPYAKEDEMMKRTRQVLVLVTIWVMVISSPTLAQLPVVPNGYTVEAYVTGLRNPTAIAFSPGGDFGYEGQLFVGDSCPDSGTIYRVPSMNNMVLFTAGADNQLHSFAFAPVGSAFGSYLYATHNYSMWKYDSTGAKSHVANINVFGHDIAFAPDERFRNNLFHADGWEPAADGEAIREWTPEGSQSPLISGLPEETAGLAFGPGGAWGSDLYVAFGINSRIQDPAIRKVTPEGVMTDFVKSAEFAQTCRLAFDTTSNFGRNLFVSDLHREAIFMINPAGEVSIFASGFSFLDSPCNAFESTDIVFGPDGAMYVADSGAGTVWRIAPELEILKPDGGEVLVAGKTSLIEWESSSLIEDVLLLYSLNNGQVWIFLDIVQNTGSYQWQLPLLTSDQCLVSIWNLDNLEIGDVSDGTFTILECQGPIVGDLNEDCYVNWQDFSIFASHWLECGNPLDPSCQTE